MAIAALRFEARQVSANDLLLASRLGDGTLQTNLPLSASLRGEIGPNGVPQSLTGRIVADAGFISDADDADGRIDIDHAEFKINWDAASRVLSVPFQILSGGNRITLLGQVEAPAQSPGPWTFKIGGGTVVLNSSGRPERSADPQSHRAERPVRSGQEALRRRQRRPRQQRSRRRHVRHGGLFQRRSSSRRRRRRDAHVGRRPEAAVAGLRRAQGARLVQRASGERQCRAAGDCGECAAQYAQGQRSAAARRRIDDRCAGDQLRHHAGRRPAGAPRRRSHRAHRRARRADRGRQGDGRSAVRAQARAVVRPVRSARYRAASNRRRACISSSTARCRPPPNFWPWTGCAMPRACRSIRRRRAAR